MPFIPELKQVRGKADVAPNWRWVVSMPELVTRISVPDFPSTYEGLIRTPTVPFGIVDHIEFGMRQIDSDARFAAGGRRHFPRFMSVPNLSVTFYEDINYSVTRYMRSWQNLIVDQNFNYGVPALYKQSIILFAFDFVSNDKPVMVGYAQGCWPTNISGYSYGYDSSGPVTLTADFCVDEDVVQVGGGASLPGPLAVAGGGPFAQFRNFTQSVRGFADEIRGGVDQIMQPVRDARALVDDGLGAVRDVVGAGRELLSLPQTLRTEIVGTVTGAQRSLMADYGYLRDSISIPRG